MINNIFNNFGDAPFKLKAAIMSNVSTGSITSIILQHYKKEMSSNILSVIGSSEIIGNPIGTARGVVNFFVSPSQINDPVGMISYIGKGTHTIISGGINVTFGSASKITSTISKGLLTAIEDKDYILKREETQDVKKNLFTGIGYGISGMFTSVASGLSGVFTKPIEGSKNEGAKGFFKGLGQGLAGVFIKPMTGALDLVSNTTEGIRNTLSTDRESVITKIREARVFYSEAYREFKKDDAIFSYDSLLDVIDGYDSKMSIQKNGVVVWTGNKSKLIVKIKKVELLENGTRVIGSESIIFKCDTDKRNKIKRIIDSEILNR